MVGPLWLVARRDRKSEPAVSPRARRPDNSERVDILLKKPVPLAEGEVGGGRSNGNMRRTRHGDAVPAPVPHLQEIPIRDRIGAPPNALRKTLNSEFGWNYTAILLIVNSNPLKRKELSLKHVTCRLAQQTGSGSGFTDKILKNNRLYWRPESFSGFLREPVGRKANFCLT